MERSCARGKSGMPLLSQDLYGGHSSRAYQSPGVIVTARDEASGCLLSFSLDRSVRWGDYGRPRSTNL